MGRTRGGNLKVRQLEVRGRGGNKAAGTVWTVSPDLVEPATAQSDTAARVEQTRAFRVGDRVAFDGRSGLVVGEVVRVNQKTLTVHAEDGTTYRVPPALVRLRQPEAERSNSSIRLETIHFQVQPQDVGLAFVADAQELLQGRSWPEVQSSWARAMVAFHERTGHPVAVRYGTLRGLNRYNQQTTLVGVWFVLPIGSCTEADLTPLYEAMRADRVHYTGAGIQSLQSLTFPSLLVDSGTLYQVWLQEEPEPVVMSLCWDDEDDMTGLVGVEAPDLQAGDLLPDVAHALMLDASGEVERT